MNDSFSIQLTWDDAGYYISVNGTQHKAPKSVYNKVMSALLCADYEEAKRLVGEL